MKEGKQTVIFGESGVEEGENVVLAKNFTGSESVYEAGAFIEEVSQLRLMDGSRVSKAFMFEGYELWWIHYNSLYTYFGIPFSRYRRLLEHLKMYRRVVLVDCPQVELFKAYLEAHGVEVEYRGKSAKQKSLPFGVLVQIILTLVFIPILALRRKKVLLSTGDKFDTGKDYDFRLGLIYGELRGRKIEFVEFIRSLESWKIVIEHAWVRRRPVVYTEAVVFLGRLLGVLTGGRTRAKRRIKTMEVNSPEDKFKLAIATQYLILVYDDIWAIKLMKWVTRFIGIRAALMIVASERSIYTVLGCKLNSIPTVGLMHGVATRYGTVFDFLPGFDGEKLFSVDHYGVWSSWWKENYIKNSRGYRPDQLHISGPIRPLQLDGSAERRSSLLRVLWVAEGQTSVSTEVWPYLKELLNMEDIELTLKLRPYKDKFEEWLNMNHPEVLSSHKVKTLKCSMHEAIQTADVAVGCHSTGVLEALLQTKVPVFINSRKWGDYYDMKATSSTQDLFVENPEELVTKIRNAQNIGQDFLETLRERYFGDPEQNGSKWVVDMIEQAI